MAETHHNMIWITLDIGRDRTTAVLDTLDSWVTLAKGTGKKVVLYGVSGAHWSNHPAVRRLVTTNVLYSSTTSKAECCVIYRADLSANQQPAMQMQGAHPRPARQRLDEQQPPAVITWT